jgi:hypothetical protein
LPDAPEPLLLERRIETRGDAYVDRVTADGRTWKLSTVDARFEDGRWTFGGQEPVWEQAGSLTPEQLDALRDAIAASGFFHTPAELRPERKGSTEVWTAELDGRRHTTTLHGRGDDGVPELEVLTAALDAATRPG